MAKFLNDYTTDDLRQLIRKSDDLPQKHKDAINNVLNARGYSGKDFVNASTEALQRKGFPKKVCGLLIHVVLVDIPVKDASDVLDELEAEKKRIREERAKRDKANRDKDDVKDRSEYYPNGFNVFWSKGGQKRTTHQKFQYSDTVRQLAMWLYVNELGGEEDTFDKEATRTGERENIDLMYKGHSMDFNKTFRAINFDPSLTVTVVFGVVGGAAQENLFDTKRERLPNFDNKNISATFEADCIMGHDPKNKKVLRVKMPCGHVFGASTLYSIVKMTIERHSKCEFECPTLKCDAKWSFDTVSAAADLDSKERKRFWQILENRRSIQEAVASNKYRECQGCHALVKRPLSVEMKRVRCNVCKNLRDFCWECGKDWQGGGFTYCGNEGCPSGELNKRLAECKKIIAKYQIKYEHKDDRKAKELECPELRACPRCLTIVRYKSSCKHMKCWGCGKNFCFMCLALQDENGKYRCGQFNDNCPVAPVQFIK